MKPENNFIKGVHAKLSKRVYREKMNNPYRGGTPDVWYSGEDRDCWIEYKYAARIPGKGKVVPDLSPLQKEWLKGRHAEGRLVFVIVGTKDGGVVFSTPDAWEDGMPVDEFRKALRSKALVASFIEAVTLGRQDAFWEETKRDRRRGNERVQDTRDSSADLRAGEVQVHKVEK